MSPFLDTIEQDETASSGKFFDEVVLVLSFFRATIRLAAWALVAAAVSGLAYDFILSTKTRISHGLEGLGLETLIAGGSWAALSGWQLWPGLLAVAIVLLVLTRRRLDAGSEITLAPASLTTATAGATAPAFGHDQGTSQPGRELGAALRSFRGALAGVAAFSGVSNVLMLTGSFFMLEIYDRVLPSRSLPTLAAIAVLAAILFLIQGLLDLTRSRLLARIGSGLDEQLSARIYDAVIRLPLRAAIRSDGLQPIRDLDTLRGFLSSNGPPALFDLPWMPLYLAIIFAFHPVLGFTALFGVLFLVAVTIMTEVLGAGPTRAATEQAMLRNSLGESGRRNAEVLAAMGMGAAMRERWEEVHRRLVGHQLRASDVVTGFGSLSRVFRMMLQSAVLAVGAYLVIKGEASAGIIIAGSILASRALAPVEMAIGNWRGFIAARQSWQRLRQLLRVLPAEALRMELPSPKDTLTVEALSGTAPGEQRVIIQDVAFTLRAGQGLAVMGPSASGKSTLARLIVGVWQPVRGSVRLDGAALDQWSSAALGRHIGYLPQDVELFAGTVAQNIARFDHTATAETVVAAARAAGVHDLIVNLKDGYATQIGEQGRALSAGQQQRIALARALYGDPFLVVLDEPNSNLDAEGDAALTEAILKVRARGGIVVVVAHRPSAIAGLSMVLAMHHGRQQIFGPRDEVLQKILRPAAAAAGPVPGATAPRAVVAEKARG